MIVQIFKFVILVLSTAKDSFQNTNREYSLMHFTKLISQEVFTPGLLLGLVLPQDIEDSPIRKWDI
jgi:hypothetical protein